MPGAPSFLTAPCSSRSSWETSLALGPPEQHAVTPDVASQMPEQRTRVAFLDLTALL